MNFTYFRAAFGALVPVLLSTACSSSSTRATETTSAQGEDLYGLGTLGAAWPSGQVPVCFQTTTDHPELQALVPPLLAGSWSKAANLTFTGFGACSGGNEVSISFVAGTNGQTDNWGYGSRSVQLVSDDTAPGRPHFGYEVVHELGHALGFAHEMQRPDNWDAGVIKQCPQTPGNTIGQYLPQSGGAYLTVNYDPDSIMNYCDPGSNNQTLLSVGDVLGVQATGGYGASSGCVFQSGATSCSVTNTSHVEETYQVPAGCPTTIAPWVLQQLSGSTWSNVAPSCADTEPAGTCTTNSPTKFTFGYQADGAAVTGPAIGSSQTVRVCDSWNNCGPSFNLTVTDCQTENGLALAASNDPLVTEQGGTGSANLVMSGPWIVVDQGQGAVATVVNNPIPGATVTLSPGNAHGFVSVMVSASFATPPGSYVVTVQVTDAASAVTRTANMNVRVDPCALSSAAEACSVPFGPIACGAHSIGCGMTTNCGTCGDGSSCSNGYCCPTGSTFSFALDACTPDAPPPPPPPPECPHNKPYCDALNACATVKACKQATGTCTGKLCQ